MVLKVDGRLDDAQERLALNRTYVVLKDGRGRRPQCARHSLNRTCVVLKVRRDGRGRNATGL